MKPIDITLGSFPNTDKQVDNARLINGFVNSYGDINLLPTVFKKVDIENPQVIFRSGFRDRLIVVTNDDVFYIENEILVEVATITNSLFPVRVAENARFEVCIVNGVGAWVFDQQNNTFNQLGLVNGFDLTNPRDVTSINTILVVVGGNENKWIISDPNNALAWQGNEITESDSRMGDLIGVEVLDNNLFIFGEGAVERWVPSTLRTPQDFPFSQDPSYQDEYGLVSTSSLVGSNNEIFYLSDNGQIRMMTIAGKGTITPEGIESIIDSFSNLERAKGNYYYYKGQWFYQLTFEEDEIAFVYSSINKKWCEHTELFRGNADEFVIFSDGVYELSGDFTTAYKNLTIQSQYIIPKYSDLKMRSVLSNVILEVTQGKNQTQDTQNCFLSLSKDNISFSNTVVRRFSPVGERLFQFRWFMNFVNNGITFKWTLHLKSDVSIKTAWAEFH